MNVRAFYRAIAVEGFESPYNVLNLKVFYPATFDESEEVLNLGIVPADKSFAPFPIVLFFSGVNVTAASYSWLGVEMAKQGFVFVTFDWVTDTLPGGKSGLTPGVDLSAMNPKVYGTKPTATALPTLIKELENIQYDSLLKGLLDLNKIILGGHSAGGSIALMNANPNFFPNIIGAFAYGSHTQGATMLGFPPDTFLSISTEIPILIMGGTNDGVISSSVKRYGKKDSDCVKPLRKTFEQDLDVSTERHLAIFEQANHFLITHPLDESSGRSYLDNPYAENNSQIRNSLAELTTTFVSTTFSGSKSVDSVESVMQKLKNQTLLSEFRTQ